MKCEDLQELLSAYSDNELDDEQRNLVKEHLENCVKCRISLDELNKTRERLLLLKESPHTHDIREKTMASIKHNASLPRYHNWFRPAAIAVPVIITLAAVLSIQFTGVFSNVSGVLAKAYTATEGLISFRAIRDEYSQNSPSDSLFQTAHGEIKYIVPNRYQLVSKIRMPDAADFPLNMEIIRIDNQVYINQLWIPFEFDEEWFDKQVPTKEKTLESLDLLIEAKELDEEEIDGTNCYHYAGTIDMEKYIERSRPKWEKLYTKMSENMGNYPVDVDEYIENMESRYRNQELTYEIWIGEEDYLIRQSKYISKQFSGIGNSSSPSISISECKYYNFNEDFIIEAPLDESGELLSDWTSYTLGE